MAAQPEQPGAIRQDRSQNLLDILWNFLASPFGAAIFLTLTALLAVVSGIVPQIPAILTESVEQARWLSEAAARWGATGDVVRSLGLFQLRDSVWWKAALGLDALALLVSLEAAVRRALHIRRLDLAEVVAAAPETRSIESDAAQAMEAIETDLSARCFLTRRANAEGVLQLHAVKRPWAAWTGAGVRFGGLLVAGALLLLSPTCRIESIAVGPGESVSLTTRAGWSLRLNEFRQTDSTPAAYFGRIALFGEEANLIGQGTIGTQHPFSAGGLTFHLSGTGPGLEVSAHSADGQALPLQSAMGTQESSLFLQFDEMQPEQYFAVPEIGDTVRVVLHPTPGDGGPAFLVQVYRGTEAHPRAEETLAAAQALTVDSVTYAFAPSPYAMIASARNPMRWLLWVGAALAAVCAVVGMAFPSSVVFVEAADREDGARARIRSDGPGRGGESR